MKPALVVYRSLLRKVKELPKESRSYYRDFARQNFSAHKEETDPERINSLLKRSVGDADFILKKVNHKVIIQTTFFFNYFISHSLFRKYVTNKKSTIST